MIDENQVLVRMMREMCSLSGSQSSSPFVVSLSWFGSSYSDSLSGYIMGCLILNEFPIIPFSTRSMKRPWEKGW